LSLLRGLDRLNAHELQVVTDIASPGIPVSHPAVTSQSLNRVRAEYFGFVRRLPSRELCEVVFQHFFLHSNRFHAALAETIFREQLERWWELAYDTLLKDGPDGLPKDIRVFPLLIFQVIAVTLQNLYFSYDPRLEELKFGPLQTFDELSKEYTECGMDMSKLLLTAKSNLTWVQQSYMRDYWLMNSGDLVQTWKHCGQTAKYAICFNIYLHVTC